MASRIQGITVEIGGDTTKLSKALESVNKSIKGTQSGLKDVNKLLKLDPSNEGTRETIIKIGLLAASIGPLLIVLGKTISTVGTAMRGFSSLAKGVRLLITHVGSASGVFSKLGVVLGGLSGPVVAVVAVIGTLVAAFMNLWNTNEEFRTAITGIWNDIVSKVKGFCDQLTQRINGLGFDFKDVTEVLKAVWDGLCQVLAPLFEGACRTAPEFG